MSEETVGTIGGIGRRPAVRAKVFQLVHLTYSLLIVAWIETALLVLWAFQLRSAFGVGSVTAEASSSLSRSPAAMVVVILAGRGFPVFLLSYVGLSWVIHLVVRKDIDVSRTWRTWFGVLMGLILTVAPFGVFGVVASAYSVCFRELIPSHQ